MLQATIQRDKQLEQEQAKGTGLRRAIGYLRNQKRPAIYAYGALIVATLAQLAVPTLVQNMIDTITNGFTANLSTASGISTGGSDSIRAIYR